MSQFSDHRKVMVLDDNLMDVITTERSLRLGGYEVVKLINPNGVLAKLDYERPDILLVDMDMGNLDIHRLLASIRDAVELEEMIVVLFSNRDAEFLQQWCIDNDLHGYYSKSMDIEQIAAFLDNFYED